MKARRAIHFLAALHLIAGAAVVPAQTNPPVRLALISISEESTAAADVLTVELSKEPNLQLLERNEIARVYREQALSGGNRDFLKLGRILGADGLLLLETQQEGTSQWLGTRLVAVKPGVMLTSGRFAWPVRDMADWAAGFANHLHPLLPKLTVLAKDAVPISVVNLRSAVQSAETRELERQLTLLAIERLSREPQVFVLERRRMDLLSAEKELAGMDDSAFWNGSYLLEGTIDRDGYSREKVTVHARLVPPRRGAALAMEASGSRTNLAEAILQLAGKVVEELKLSPSAPAWNPGEEADRFFAEARWALRWNLYPEAQAAADSAWSLGKQDLDCASARVKAYVAHADPMKYGLDVVFPLRNEKLDWEAFTRKVSVAHPYAAQDRRNGVVRYVTVKNTPDPQAIDRALQALEVYEQFSRASPDGEPKVESRWKDSGWYNSAWYDLGLESLVAASQVLRHFCFVPDAQPPVAEKLAALRARARSVAARISSSASVHDSYYVGDRIAVCDELHATIWEKPNIYRCQVKWGCYWQERPEDSIVLYRGLMSSPVFRYIHEDFWHRQIIEPRLAAWSGEARERIPAIWESFMRELAASTNVLFRLEAQALHAADAKVPEERTAAYTNLLAMVFTHRDELVANNVDLLYLGWGLGSLIPSDDTWHKRYYSEISPELERMRADYQRKTIEGRKKVQAFEKQKRFLSQGEPYDFSGFAQTFSFRDYSRAQAAEIQPLLAAYKSNLLARAGGGAVDAAKARHDAHWIEVFLESRVNSLLDRHPEFDKQKAYLAGNTPYEPRSFDEATRFRQYSKAQAMELQPLLAAYKSNLTAQAARKSAGDKTDYWFAFQRIAILELLLTNAIHPPARGPAPAPGPLDALLSHAAPGRRAAAVRPAVREVERVRAAGAVANALRVDSHLKIPRDQLAVTNLSRLMINAHRWSGGKLVLALWYQGAFGNYYQASQAGAAIYDPQNQSWDVIPFPRESVEDRYGHDLPFGALLPGAVQPGFGFELFHGEFYLSHGGQILKLNLRTRQWKALNVPQRKDTQFYVVNDRLYAANGESIFEIIDGGDGARILASTRRRPAVSALDSMGWLGLPFLFSGPGSSLRASAGTGIFAWDGSDWHQEFSPADFGSVEGSYPAGPSRAPDLENPEGLTLGVGSTEAFGDAVLFRRGAFNGPSSIWLLERNRSAPELCFQETPKRRPGSASLSPPSAASARRPLWPSPSGEHLASASAAVFHGNLLFLAGPAPEPDAGEPGGSKATAEPLPCHARLFWFSRDLPEPVIVPLQLNPPPAWLSSGAPSRGSRRPGSGNWMLLGDHFLFLGEANAAGVWALPMARVEAAIAAEKPRLAARIARDNTAADQHRRDLLLAAEHRRQELLSVYDKNHNGSLDQDERQEALEDPAFLEFEYDKIDTNRNAMLDIDEISYFDANTNAVLDLNEERGIVLFLATLAGRLLEQYDADHNGLLDRAELLNIHTGVQQDGQNYLYRAATSDLDQLDPDRIQSLLARWIWEPLSRPRISRFHSVPWDSRRAIHGRPKNFKEAVEVYWDDQMLHEWVQWGSDGTNGYRWVKWRVQGTNMSSQVEWHNAPPTNSWSGQPLSAITNRQAPKDPPR